MNPELINYINTARQAGKSNELIRQELLNVGWPAKDVDKVLTSSDSSTSQQLLRPSQDMSPTTQGEPIVAPKKEKAKKHFIAPLIFFVVIVGLNFLVGYLGQALGSKDFIVGIFMMALLLTAIFVFLSFMIRKISEKFGKKGAVMSWIFLVIFLCIGAWILYQNRTPYVLYPNGSVLLNKDISLNECITTKDEVIKYACGTNYSIKLKDRSLCRTVYGNNDKGYYCEDSYDTYYHTSPNDINECQSMIADSENSLFYKDGCFRGVAIRTFNKQVCSYLYREDDQKNCITAIDAEQCKKNNLCGPLYVNGRVPANYECDEYVFSQHDLSKCNLLTPAWNKGACTKYVKDFLSKKSQYDTVKQSKRSLLAMFDGRSDLRNCSYAGGGPGTAYDYAGQCKYSRTGDTLSLQIDNTSVYPLLFSSSPGELSDVCPGAYIKSIDGGNNFATQINAGEVFLLDVRCPSEGLDKIKQIYIPDKISGSGQEVNGSLRVNLQSQ